MKGCQWYKNIYTGEYSNKKSILDSLEDTDGKQVNKPKDEGHIIKLLCKERGIVNCYDIQQLINWLDQGNTKDPACGIQLDQNTINFIYNEAKILGIPSKRFPNPNVRSSRPSTPKRTSFFPSFSSFSNFSEDI